MVIFYYFLKKAASLLPKSTVRQWTKVIKIMTLASAAIYFAFGIEYSIVNVKRNKNPDPNAKGFCKSA